MSRRIPLCLLFLLINFVMACGDVSCQELIGEQLSRHNEAIRIYNQALGMLTSGEYSKSLELLKRASELDPLEPLIQNNYALALMKTGHTDEAIELLDKAVGSANPLVIAWLNLGYCYEAKGEFAKAIEFMEKYLSESPSGPDADKTRAHIILLKKESLSRSGERNDNDYFDAVTKTNKMRWHADKMPIKVYMESGEGVTGFKPIYANLLSQAFTDWETASAGKVKFAFVDNKKQADITTCWSHDLSDIVSRSEGADTSYVGRGNDLVNVSIKLLTINPSETMKLTPGVVNWIVHHEVGHALGLLGHSTVDKDVMYFSAPLAEQEVKLSERDINTLNRLYTETFGPTMSSLNAEGLAASATGDSDLAIKKFEEALNLEPSALAPAQNLTREQYTIGVNLAKQNRLPEAEIHFARALSLENKAPDSHLAQILYDYDRLLLLEGKNAEAKSLKAKYASIK